MALIEYEQAVMSAIKQIELIDALTVISVTPN